MEMRRTVAGVPRLPSNGSFRERERDEVQRRPTGGELERSRSVMLRLHARGGFGGGELLTHRGCKPLKFRRVP
eukprot:3768528-Pyramimonas_sp.AAC.1